MANISTIKVGSTSYGITATPTAHASTATTYGAASASNYGHVKLSDNYTSSAGAAASGIGASSKAVADCYNSIISDMDWTYAGGTGINVYYNRANLRMQLAVQQYTLAADSNDSSSIALPYNITANVDFYFQALVLNANWRPLSTIGYGCIIGGTRKIEIRASAALSNAILLADIMVTRELFTIT